MFVVFRIYKVLPIISSINICSDLLTLWTSHLCIFVTLNIHFMILHMNICVDSMWITDYATLVKQLCRRLRYDGVFPCQKGFQVEPLLGDKNKPLNIQWSWKEPMKNHFIWTVLHVMYIPLYLVYIQLLQ